MSISVVQEKDHWVDPEAVAEVVELLAMYGDAGSSRRIAERRLGTPLSLEEHLYWRWQWPGSISFAVFPSGLLTGFRRLTPTTSLWHSPVLSVPWIFRFERQRMSVMPISKKPFPRAQVRRETTGMVLVEEHHAHTGAGV